MISSLFPFIPWIIGLLGLIVGSFLNVVVLREGKESIGGRSHCPGCKKILSWYELVPLFSFLVQRGKCRNCSMPISRQYPFGEFMTAILFFITACYVVLEGLPIVSLIPLLIAVAFAFIIAVYDVRTKLVPLKWLLGWIIAGAVFLMMVSNVSLSNLWFQIQGLVVALPFLLIWIISRGRWMGFADIEIIAWMGIFFGIMYGASSVLLAFYSGAGIAILFIIYQTIRGKSYQSIRKLQVPFAPFLLFAWFATLMWHWNIFTLFARIWM